MTISNATNKKAGRIANVRGNDVHPTFFLIKYCNPFTIGNKSKASTNDTRNGNTIGPNRANMLIAMTNNINRNQYCNDLLYSNLSPPNQ